MRIRLVSAISAVCCLLGACSGGDSVSLPDISGMTLREKVSKLFFIRPESLVPGFSWPGNEALEAYSLQEVTDSMRAVAEQYPAGGIILFAHNIKDREQLMRFGKDLHGLKGSPLLCVDEEGGRVARVANNRSFGLPRYKSMTALAEKGPEAVEEAAGNIGRYLKELGFDVDFAPVADVNTNPKNVVIGPRAFSDNPVTAGEMVAVYLKALQNEGVTGCLKHFPGHGDTRNDTHLGYAVSNKSREELLQCEFLPFKAGIEAGARMVMSAHVSLPAVTGSDVPSTLSPEVLQGLLREELGFEGIIVTDAMEMGAITQKYPVEEACLMAIKAGADVLLCVKDYCRCVDRIVEAVETGDLPPSRIDQSVIRLLLAFPSE
ncbi:MAG: glycoside hydrolase [Bacteroidales bacterium]|nr:glycoside hydrolase [Bacteroidales bacterium]